MEGNTNLEAEHFEGTPVQPDDETGTCCVVDNAVVRADTGATGSPRGLRCERHVPDERRRESPLTRERSGQQRVNRIFYANTAWQTAPSEVFLVLKLKSYTKYFLCTHGLRRSRLIREQEVGGSNPLAPTNLSIT
jgi:hypothetical protein